MHSLHSWAQMAEQMLVIILLMEHSDMHIYVPPSKKKGKNREPCDLHFHLLMQNQTFTGEGGGGDHSKPN